MESTTQAAAHCSGQEMYVEPMLTPLAMMLTTHLCF